MKDKNAAAQELGRLSAKRFDNWTTEEKSKYFKEIRTKRKTKAKLVLDNVRS